MKELERLQVWEAPRLRLFALAFALLLASFQVHPQTHIISKLGFNQNYNTFT